MSIRTDLAVEAHSAHNISEGITSQTKTAVDLTVTETVISSESASEKTGKPCGRYITAAAKNTLDNHSDMFARRAGAVAEEIKALLPTTGSVMAVGLGNRSITPDSLGPAVCDHIFATRHIKKLAPDIDTDDLREVSVLIPGVMGKTGTETAEMVRAAIDAVSPSAVITVDSLACMEFSNLAKTVQITDTGISPGSGVMNARAELSKKTLGIPVISIGVPTVVDMQTIAEYIFKSAAPDGSTGFMVTPKDIDKLIFRSARLVSAAINLALFPSLTLEEITSLVE